MSKPIVMSPDQWLTILYRIKQREKPSVYLSRERMKAVLGFTVRDHREYVKDLDYVKLADDDWSNPFAGGDSWYEGKTNVHTVRLDFYDEQKRTMFLLRYGNGQT
jgi:hypothetical protein